MYTVSRSIIYTDKGKMDELRRLLTSSMCSLSELYVVEREKLKERISQNDF